MADDVIRNVPARYPARYGVHLSDVINRVSWGAVWAGALIALGMEALLLSFGMFIGFGMYNWRAANPSAGVSGWTIIWYLVTAGWSMFFGAWCAARLSGNPVREAGILHGITTWALAATLTVLMMAVGVWSMLKVGMNLLNTAAIAGAEVAPGAIAPQAGQAMNQLQMNAGPVAQNTANVISGVSLLMCGGMLVGFITAIIGGSLGRPRSVVIEERTVPGPTSLAA
jgi:hypothetical protein